jgi:cytoskeletal protein RodZ
MWMDEAGGFSDPTLFKDSVGQRLRSARERAGLDLDDIAARTRVPLRHLKAIEASDYSQMPSATYSVGFVKSFARAVGMDDAELGRDLRIELGTQSPLDAANSQAYEPVDPTRIPPKWLALTAALLAALLFGGYMLWRHRAANDVVPSLVEQAPVAGAVDNAAIGPAPSNAVAPAITPAVTANAATPNAGAAVAQSNNAASAAAPAQAGGTVVITATKAAWMRIYDADDKVLFEREMKAGESYTVPAGANNPQIRTGAAELLSVTVAGKAVPQLGRSQHTIKDVGVSAASLLARTPATSASASAAPATASH